MHAVPAAACAPYNGHAMPPWPGEHGIINLFASWMGLGLDVWWLHILWPSMMTLMSGLGSLLLLITARCSMLLLLLLLRRFSVFILRIG